MNMIFSFRNVVCACSVALIGLAGCADGVVDTHVAAEAPAKLRHAHLVQGTDEAGKIVERYSAYEDFVVGVSSFVVDMDKIVERYSNEPGVTIKRTYKKAFRGFALHIDPAYHSAVLGRLDGDDEVAFYEPDVRFQQPTPKSSDYPSGNHQTLPWNVSRVGGHLSSTLAGNGSGTVQGVDLYILDTGIKDHDVNVVEQRNFVPGADPNVASDGLGHGTHVAGTAAARDNGFGVVGVAPGASIYNFKVLDANGEADLSTIVAAVEEITNRKAANPARPMVVNMSFGGDVGTTAYTVLDEAIAASVAEGIVYVVAAGNEGIDAATVTPAHTAEAITVGAYDDRDLFAGYSNYGPAVDVLAPGTGVVSSNNANGAKSSPVVMSGTSMAAPHVAGAAVLYLSRNPSATPAQVRAALLGAAQGGIAGAPQSTTSSTLSVSGF